MPEKKGPAPEPGPGEEARDRSIPQFVGLFLVPLLVVAVCVAVFMGFGWIAYSGHSVGDYLNDLKDPSPIRAHRRKQAAYELSKILAGNPGALSDEPGARAELRRLFRTTDDQWVKRYLALVFGHIGDPEAVPLLLETLGEDDSQTTIYALWSLGAIGDPAARPSLLGALGDADPGIRKTAAFALGGLGDPSVTGDLEGLLADPVVDVRWNAAVALAHLGSPAGAPVLEQMLDRDLLGQVPGITPQQQEEAMISALRAVERLGGGGLGTVVGRLADKDPSLKVRQAAIETQRSLGREEG